MLRNQQQGLGINRVYVPVISRLYVYLFFSTAGAAAGALLNRSQMRSCGIYRRSCIYLNGNLDGIYIARCGVAATTRVTK